MKVWTQYVLWKYEPSLVSLKCTAVADATSCLIHMATKLAKTDIIQA